MTATFKNLRWQMPPYWILLWHQFRYHKRIPNSSLNSHTLFGESWLNSQEINSSFFLNPNWWHAPSWIMVTFALLASLMCSYWKSQHKHQNWRWSVKQQRNSSTFINTRWRQPPSWTLVTCIFNVTDVFSIEVATFPPNLEIIDKLVKK